MVKTSYYSSPPLLGKLVPTYVSDILLGGSSPRIYLAKKEIVIILAYKKNKKLLV